MDLKELIEECKEELRQKHIRRIKDRVIESLEKAAGYRESARDNSEMADNFDDGEGLAKAMIRDHPEWYL